QQPGSLEWVPSQRAEPDHPAASSSSLTASVRTTGAGRRRAFLTARQNSSVALSIASSRLSASTISWAPYRFVPIPVAMPPVAATASASSTTSSRLSTRSPSTSIPTLHLTARTLLVKHRQQGGEPFQAGQVVAGQQQVDVRRGHHHPERARPEGPVVALV